MADSKRVTVIRLDEKMLWKLHDKLQKLKAKENTPEAIKNEAKEEISPQPRKTRAKPAKFQVYQPGVTRLSNRKLAANFDFAPTNAEQKQSPRNTDSASPRVAGSNEPRQSDASRRDRSWSENRRPRGRGRGALHARDPGRQRNGSQRCDDDEEGFLGRHRRRRREGEEVDNYSDDQAEDDELAWDNYGSSGLVHTGWSPQVTTTETSSQEGVELSDSELYEELSEDEKPGVGVGRDRKQEKAVVSGGSHHSSDADVPSVATSESNKEYYKVAHNLSENEESDDGHAARGDHRREDTSADEYESEDYDEDGEEGEFDPPAPTRGKPQRQLYDPDNPDSPIMVKRPQGRRDQGHFNVATSGDNVYNPSLSKERMMIKIRPSRTRRRKSPNRNGPRYSSPPCYHGNSYHPDEGQWQRGYDTPSPTGRNYRHPSENLSEDEDTVASQSHKRRQSCMSMLHEAEQHENMLSSILLTPSFDSHEYTDSLTRIRNKLKIVYEGIITKDIEGASKHNVEQLLWRNVYYQVIEILREQIRSCPEQEGSELKINLILLLDQGTAFYESLLENLQQKYRFNLKEILNSASARKKHRTKARKRSKLAIVSCQRIFICLGDIARYREQANNSLNYGRARHCYLQAQILAPKNGRPYNQLAVLAVRTRHKLDAVYYYVRSLAASNPILSARESLMVLFDEIRRKLDYVQNKKDAAAAEKTMANLKVEDKRKAQRSRSNGREASPRRWEEVWILPGEEEKKETKRASKEAKTTKDPDVPELTLPLSDIPKHFVLLFLNAHGKLFTRIGLESFSEILTKTIRLFSVTLENPKLMSNQRLLQLYAINLFAVLNADKLSIHGSVRDSTQNLHRALQLVFSMFAVTVDQTNRIFETSDADFDPFASEHLQVVLPSIKIMFDWMYANKDCWYPPAKDLTDTGLNIWESLATLCNWVCNHPCTKSTIQIYNEPADGLHEVFLSEDTQLAGFSPLGQAFSDPRFVEAEIATPENKSYLQQCVRMSLVRDFLEYLCGMEEPLLAFKQGKYVAVMPHRLSSWSDKSNNEDSFISSDYDIDDFSTPSSDQPFLSEGNNSTDHEHREISELRMYRDSLQLKKELHEKRKNQIQSSLDSEEKVKLEICPKYLVPDTNCFIDHLQLIEKLVSCGKFIVSTPLVVISELEGLAKGSKSATAHAENVHRSANSAVDFINECFVANDPRFCALTRRGTELKSLRFRSEESESTGNNDDIILESTHAYAVIHSKKAQSPDGGKIVRGKVVLLTDDRNLRLKALLLQDMATKDIVEFCRWVKL